MRNILFNLRDVIMIGVGLIVFTIGYSCFMLPYHITSGGLSGAAALFFFATGFPPAYTYFLVNVLLLLFALKVMGWKYTLKTLVATTLVSVLIDLGQAYVTLEDGTMMRIIGEQKFMACILAGIMEGTGLGLVFLAGGSTGGTDIIASAINKNHSISLGRAMLMIDVVIVSMNYVVLENIESLVMSYCMMFISINMIDYVVNGARQSVQFMIISDKYAQIATRINKDADRGCTILDAHGWYSGKEKPVLLVMAKKYERKVIFDIVHQEDPKAFISMANVEGVFGEGFDKMKK